jgi:hypothetical protein
MMAFGLGLEVRDFTTSTGVDAATLKVLRFGVSYDGGAPGAEAPAREVITPGTLPLTIHSGWGQLLMYWLLYASRFRASRTSRSFLSCAVLMMNFGLTLGTFRLLEE